MKVLGESLVPRMWPAPRDSSVPAGYYAKVYGYSTARYVVPRPSPWTRPGTDEPSAHPWHHISNSCCIKGRHFQVYAATTECRPRKSDKTFSNLCSPEFSTLFLSLRLLFQFLLQLLLPQLLLLLLLTLLLKLLLLNLLLALLLLLLLLLELLLT